jgi:hypothetical protein
MGSIMTESSSTIETPMLWRSEAISSSDCTVITSMGGLVECEKLDRGVPRFWGGGTIATSASSTLSLTWSLKILAVVSAATDWATFGGGGGEEVESFSGAFLRLRVAMPDGGSVNGSQTGGPVSEVFGAIESG